jgi:hypothetical protein
MASLRYSTAAFLAAVALGATAVVNGAETAPAAAAGAAKPQEASIPFANEGGIRDWQADGVRGIWVQDNHRRWYYGRFLSPCIGLQFVYAVRFRTGPGGELDRFGAVRARDTGNCTFTSFTLSEGPPKKPAKKPEAKSAPHAPAASAPPAAPATPPPGG